MHKRLLFCFIFLMQFTLENVISATTIHQETLLLSECDDYLLSLGIDSQPVLNKFSEKGGTFVRMQDVIFTLLPGDRVYPICTGGYCRSQTLWRMLLDCQLLDLQPPHATRVGYDPYNNQMNWHRNDPHEGLYDEYEIWAGRPKAVRFGYDIFSSWHPKESATAEEIAYIREYYDQYFYTVASSQRHVYICFDKNTQVVMHRLAELNPSLDNVVVLHFPLKDLVSSPLPEWNTFLRSQEAYEKFSLILKPTLDLSLVQ